MKEAFGDISFWIAGLYQPFLVLIVMPLFSQRLDEVINGFFNGQGNIVYLIVLAIFIIGIILFVNAFIELLYRVIKLEAGDYEKFFEIQKTAHGYMMVINSLIASCVAIVDCNSYAPNLTRYCLCLEFLFLRA